MALPVSSPNTLESKSSKLLRELLASGRPILYVMTAEEQRIARLLSEGAQQFFAAPLPSWSWSLTEGMVCSDGTKPGHDTTNPRVALDFIADYQGSGIFHLKDFHEPLREAVVVRRLRDLYQLCFGKKKFVVITSPIRFIPEEISRNIVYIELNVPVVVIGCFKMFNHFLVGF